MKSNKTNQQKEKEMQKYSQLNNLPLDRRMIIVSHADVAEISALLSLPQVDAVKFVNLMRKVYARVNYLQELMIVKAFDNSIEITKAYEFMNALCDVHEKYSTSVRKFVADQ